MNWLVRTSLELRFLMVGLAALLLVLGIDAIEKSNLDVFPEFAPPLIEIQTECPGLTSEEVEALVTVPLESVLGGVPSLDKLRSKSVPGLSDVVLFFDHGTDVLRIRQLVQERITTAVQHMPDVAEPPVILSPLSTTSRVLKIGVSSKEMSLIDLSTLVKWTIRPRLMAVPGVANVSVWGLRDRELQVLVDPVHLREVGTSLEEVVTAARDATHPEAGGFIDTPQQRIGISHRSAIQTAADLARVVVRADERGVLTLGDAAEVGEGHPPLIGEGVVNDEPGILMVVEKQPWGNTLDVTRGVEETLDALKPALKGVELDPTIFRPATFIERAMHNLRNALLIGCVLVIGILLAFLWEWRTALISMLAIPLSLVTAVLVLNAFDQTINTMVLAGLAIALGELVDDAIIDVENIVRRLRLEREAPSGESTLAIVLSASLEVRHAIVYATLIVALALLPVFFMEGLSGAFFRPLATGYVLAVLASMAVAMTVTPALSLLLLGGHIERTRESPLLARVKARYLAFLPLAIDQRRRVFAIALGTTLLALVLLPFYGEEFLPTFKETDFLMHWVTKPGTSLTENRRITMRVSKELRAVPGVRNFGAHLARAEQADEIVGANFTELWISVDEAVDYDETYAKIQEVVDGYPGIQRDVLTYLRERVKEVLSGSSTTIVVRIFGEDLGELRRQAQRVRTALADVPGIAGLKVETQVQIPQLEIRPRLAALTAAGLSPRDIRRETTLLIQGERVGQIFEQQKVFDVVVRGRDQVRRTLESVADLSLDGSNGAQVRLGDVASVRVVPAENSIKREASSRRLDVGCNVQDRDLGDVAKDIEARLAQLDFPRGYHPELLGEYRARQEASGSLLRLSGLALIGILFLLQAAFGSWRLAFLVLATLPAALVGGLFAAGIGGGSLSLGALVGFVTVLGIAARNGIMMVSHYQHLEQVEGVPFGFDLVVRGALERLSPITMTSLAMGLALIPLVLSGARPGNEIEHPMAIVILGGLVTSYLMNLVVLPPLYLLYGRPARVRTDL